MDISEFPQSRRLDDRYVLGDPVRSGAMGAVYGAHDLEGRALAAKRMHDVENGKRFEIEARLLTRLSHPRVVRVVDFLDDPKGRFLMMEWIEGEDLARLLRSQGTPGLPLDRVTELALEACEALRYVHEQHVIHRDVKPQNLMLGRERGVVLVDFGIARDLEAEPGATWQIGTPGFMAPEAYVGGPFTPSTDVFGLAATVWTLLAGEPPRMGQRGGPPGADSALVDALGRALEPDSRERTASIEEFAQALGGRMGPERGRQLGRSLSDDPRGALLTAVVKTAAGVFGAAAASIALTQRDGSLVYAASWGAGSDGILGMRLTPGTGISGNVVVSGRGEVVEDCRGDPRFAGAVAELTGYVPHTMLALPLRRSDRVIGVLSVLDQRDGLPYDIEDLARAEMFAELAVVALDTADAGPTLDASPTTEDRGPR